MPLGIFFKLFKIFLVRVSLNSIKSLLSEDQVLVKQVLDLTLLIKFDFEF